MYIEIGYPKDAVISKEEIDDELNKTLKNLKKLVLLMIHLN